MVRDDKREDDRNEGLELELVRTNRRRDVKTYFQLQNSHLIGSSSLNIIVVKQDDLYA